MVRPLSLFGIDAYLVLFFNLIHNGRDLVLKYRCQRPGLDGK